MSERTDTQQAAAELVRKFRGKAGAHSPPAPEVWLFASVDLQDSTVLKQRDSRWPFAVRHFYEICSSEFTKGDSGFSVWKYLGDEVLFVCRLGTAADLVRAVSHALATCARIETQLSNHATSRRVRQVRFKPALWIARVRETRAMAQDRTDVEPDVRNVRLSPGTDTPAAWDFLGPSIDAGFRMASKARPGFVAMSPELTLALADLAPAVEEALTSVDDGGNARSHHVHGPRFATTADVARVCRVVRHCDLKGVWDGHLYPIIWYHPDWPTAQASLTQEERLRQTEDWHYVCAQAERSEVDEASLIDLRALLGENHAAFEYEALVRQLTEASAEDTSTRAEAEQHPAALAVHCVAVCVTREQRVMIARRPARKRVQPGKWEFGCAQVVGGQTFEQALIAHYGQDFGVAIEPDIKTPIGTYWIEESGVNGVLFPARLPDADDLKRGAWEQHHDEVRLLTMDELNGIAADDCVPGLHDMARRAVQVVSGS